MYKYLTIAITVLLLNSCTEQVEKFEYYKFSKQITPNGKYIIYDYARNGPMAFSSDISGIELFKIEENFSEGKGQKINGTICSWLSNDTLLVYNCNFEGVSQPKDTLPLKIDYKKLDGIVIKTIYHIVNSSGSNRCKFDSIRTTKDSIFIRIIEKNKKTDYLKFPLGSCSIKTSSNTIVNISIFSHITKNMDFIFNNSDGTKSKGLPSVGEIWYEFTPTKKITFKHLNKRKIFWENRK